MNDSASLGQGSAPSQILIVEDHPLVREALRQLLNGQEGLEVVGEAEDGLEGLEMCRRLRPDLVLMDVRMPRMDGVEATRAIKGELPRTVVLMLTALEDPQYMREALKAGAAGYVLKHASHQQIADSVRGTLAGESPLNSTVAMQLLLQLMKDEALTMKAEASTADGEMSTPSPSEKELSTTEASPLLGLLTKREVEVLRLISLGQTNQEIARSLLLSVSTVKGHVRQIISKLGVSDRTQAAIMAVRAGLQHEGLSR